MSAGREVTVGPGDRPLRAAVSERGLNGAGRGHAWNLPAVPGIGCDAGRVRAGAGFGLDSPFATPPARSDARSPSSSLHPATIAQAPPSRAREGEIARWEREARAATIVRDDWGIAHVHGKTDADAVFGMIYAQAEDDFNRIETNYLNAMGRLAEAEGESAIWQDLRMKLFIDPDSMRAKYAASPAWLKRLMNAWADGLNYYLHTHPKVKPRVITRFEPWMALTFSEGSIGGDIESVVARPARGVLRRQRRPSRAGRGGRRRGNRLGLERLRDRAVEHRQPPGAPAHQPPHLVLLPRRAADERATRGSTPTARRPGASSSSTRASTTGSAGCTPPPARTRSTSTPRRSCGRGSGSSTGTAARSGRS